MYFKEENEISDLVRAFETCELNPAEFRHYQHLAVALWYVKQFPYDEASDKMREGIKRLAAAYGKMGYHETITMFWLKLVRGCVAGANGSGLVELANRVASEFGGNKKLIADYYSEELLTSARAKNEWVEPDLKELEFESEPRAERL